MKKLITNQKYEFRNSYYADENGHIWSSSKNDYLKEYDDKNGYKKVVLMTTDRPSSKGHRFSVHRLILSTFNPIENMRELQVDHINGNHQDNRLENLRWTATKENLENPNTKPNRRVYDQDGTHNASAKLNSNNIFDFVRDCNSGQFTRKQIMEKYEICEESLHQVVVGKTYIKEMKELGFQPKFLSSMGRDTSGEKNGRAKLTEKEVKEIIDLLLLKEKSGAEIGRMYNVSAATISHIKKKDTWKYLTENIDFD